MAKQIRAARHYQQRNDPLRRLVDRAIPGISADIKDALKGLSGLIPQDADRHASAGDWHAVKNSIDWGHFREVLKGVFGQVGKAREAGAQHGADKINAAFAAAGRAVRFRKESRYSFDLYSQDVQDELRRAQDDLIAELEQDVRDAIDQIVLDGARLGLGPEEIMDDIRSMVGLTARQSQAAMNYRDMLENLDPGALQRQLRNFLEDDNVQAAIDSGQSLDGVMVDKLTSDYIDNYIDYRAETIAQTEATRAVSLGLQDSYQQAIDRGVFPSEAVKQFWQVDLDEVTCPICLSIPDMNSEGIAIDEAFDSIDGPQDNPPVHPNCRCSIEIVTDLDMVDSDGVDAGEAA